MGKAGRGIWILLCVLLLLLAAGWTAWRWEGQEKRQEAVLPASCVKGREGESLPVALPTGPVAVNSATLDELCTLNGIGPSLAEAILTEREANGDFHFPEDLQSVKGIGQKKLEGFRDQIRME